MVFTNNPLRKVLQSPVAATRLIHWEMELNEFDIEYLHRKAIKAHIITEALANFAKGVEMSLSLSYKVSSTV